MQLAASQADVHNLQEINKNQAMIIDNQVQTQEHESKRAQEAFEKRIEALTLV